MKKKEPKVIEMHQHLGLDGVPIGILHPVKGKHTKQSTIESHNYTQLKNFGTQIRGK
jgi:hypothetical protein